MVCEEPRGVIFLFDHRFPQERERPRDFQIVKSLPFRPESFVGFPGALRHGALQETMLRRFLLVVVAHLAERGKTHRLQPGPDWEASIENQLDERAHLLRVYVMPNSGRQLGRGCVSQVEVIEEDSHARCLHGFANVGVTPFCRVPKKGGVAQRRVRQPMPFPQILG